MKNSIFIVIDAMRNYKSSNDERGRQEVFDILPQKGFSVLDGICVTAPSSLMSSVTMLTGKHAYSQFPNYQNTDFSRYEVNTLTKKLKTKGISTYGLFSAREMREKLKSEYSYINSKYLISKSAYLQERWTNRYIYEQVKFLVSENFFDHKFHLMLWFNSLCFVFREPPVSAVKIL